MFDLETGKQYQSFADLFNKDIPEYYPTMFLDGYSPQDIFIAHNKLTRRKYLEYREKQYAEMKAKQDAKEQEATDDFEVNVNANVSVKK